MEKEQKNKSIWSNEKGKSLVTLIGCLSIYGITISLFTPLLSIVLESKGISTTIIGGLAMMTPAGIILGSFGVPYLLIKYEGRYLLIFGVITEIILIFSLIITQSIASWFIIRFIGGLVGAILFIVSETWIISVTPSAHRGKVMGLYNTTFALSLSIGPLVLTITGSQSILPFLLGIALMVFAGLPLLWVRGFKLNSKKNSGFGVISFSLVAPLLVIGSFVVAFREITAASLLPVYGLRLGMNENYSTLMLFFGAAGGALLQFPLGWASDNFEKRKVFLTCSIVSLLGALIWPFVLNISYLLWITLFIWGGFFTGIYTISMVFAADWFKDTKLTTAIASLGVFWGIGSFIGPFSGGLIMDYWDPYGLPLILFAVTFIFFIISLFPKFYLSPSQNS